MSSPLTRRQLGVALAIGGAAAALGVSPAAASAGIARSVVNGAAETVRAMRQGGAREDIDFLLPRAVGVMVFPRLIKAGVLIGGEGGDGVVLGRSDMGWSHPAFVALGSGSVGLQLGVQRSRAFLIVMDPATLERSLSTGLRFGVDVNAVIGRDGIATGATTQTAFERVYAFVDNEAGVFIGASLEGSVIGVRESLNEAFYGQKASAREIVLERRLWNPAADPLVTALG